MSITPPPSPNSNPQPPSYEEANNRPNRNRRRRANQPRNNQNDDIVRSLRDSLLRSREQNLRQSERLRRSQLTNLFKKDNFKLLQITRNRSCCENSINIYLGTAGTLLIVLLILHVILNMYIQE